MQHYKKMGVALALVSFMLAGISATRPAEGPPKRNLKILPKNISHEDLDKVMDGFKAALGVKCNFCHAASADSSSHKLDFASDEKPEKNTARRMMIMTAKINKKYFGFIRNDQGVPDPPISCMTCHRGNSHPELK
jgi:hypothetical protein